MSSASSESAMSAGAAGARSTALTRTVGHSCASDLRKPAIAPSCRRKGRRPPGPRRTRLPSRSRRGRPRRRPRPRARGRGPARVRGGRARSPRARPRRGRPPPLSRSRAPGGTRALSRAMALGQLLDEPGHRVGIAETTRRDDVGVGRSCWVGDDALDAISTPAKPIGELLADAGLVVDEHDDAVAGERAQRRLPEGHSAGCTTNRPMRARADSGSSARASIKRERLLHRGRISLRLPPPSPGRSALPVPRSPAAASGSR